MSRKNFQNANLIIDRVKDAYNIPTDSRLADFLNVAPSTISTWKRRNTLDYDLLFAKCKDLSADYLLYGKMPIFRKDKEEGEPSQNYKTNINKPSEIWPNDPVLAEYEHRIEQLANTIEHGPFSKGLKMHLVESLLRIIGQELDEHRTKYLSDQEGSEGGNGV